MAAFFLDSSAAVKRYVQETGSAWVSNLLGPGSPNFVYLARITGVEVVSAITRRARAGSLSASVAAQSISEFRLEYDSHFHFVPITSRLLLRAMDLSENHGLRAYDAVQLAAARQLHLQRSTVRFDLCFRRCQLQRRRRRRRAGRR